MQVLPGWHPQGRDWDGLADRRHGRPWSVHAARHGGFAAGHPVLRHQFLAIVRGAKLYCPDVGAVAHDARQ